MAGEVVRESIVDTQLNLPHSELVTIDGGTPRNIEGSQDAEKIDEQVLGGSVVLKRKKDGKVNVSQKLDSNAVGESASQAKFSNELIVKKGATSRAPLSKAASAIAVRTIASPKQKGETRSMAGTDTALPLLAGSDDGGLSSQRQEAVQSKQSGSDARQRITSG